MRQFGALRFEPRQLFADGGSFNVQSGLFFRLRGDVTLMSGRVVFQRVTTLGQLRASIAPISQRRLCFLNRVLRCGARLLNRLALRLPRAQGGLCGSDGGGLRIALGDDFGQIRFGLRHPIGLRGDLGLERSSIDRGLLDLSLQ